jgi:predicted nucleic acid-binding protein
MMNLVDSCGWIEYLSNGPNAAFYARPLQDAGALLVPAVCMYEVFKRVSQLYGEASALSVVTLMRKGTVAAMDESISLGAAALSITHKLHFADSVILATARQHGALVYTQDEHLRHFPEVRFPGSSPHPPAQVSP